MFPFLSMVLMFVSYLTRDPHPCLPLRLPNRCLRADVHKGNRGRLRAGKPNRASKWLVQSKACIRRSRFLSSRRISCKVDSVTFAAT